MKYRGDMSIEQVLADMRENPSAVFWLQFVRSAGKNRGSVKIVARCGYGAPQATARAFVKKWRKPEINPAYGRGHAADAQQRHR